MLYLNNYDSEIISIKFKISFMRTCLISLFLTFLKHLANNSLTFVGYNTDIPKMKEVMV